MANEYRIFVGAFPQGELAERIQAIRLKYDPVTARITPPHATLAGTYWRSGAPVPESETEIIRRLQILPGILLPFQLVLGGIRTFPGERPVVYLDVEINQELIEARNLLQSVIGPDKHRAFHPHLTLAMRLPWEEAWTMARDLEDSPWNKQQYSTPIDSLHLMQRGKQDRTWRSIYRLDLGGTHPVHGSTAE
jgi:2'-5' RNA ligase